jgi:hypothetical protein
VGHTTDHARRYRNWHWGADCTQIIEWRDPDYPAHLIEIGRLAELHVLLGPRGGKRVIHVAPEHMDGSHLAFDPDHSRQRLYVLTPDAVRRAARRNFWDASASITLEELARKVGGGHLNGYPDVRVSPVGTLTHVTYLTLKEGDGVSLYIHHLGEEDIAKGKEPRQPMLAVDAKGRFWIVGGAYHCPVPGITN